MLTGKYTRESVKTRDSRTGMVRFPRLHRAGIPGSGCAYARGAARLEPPSRVRLWLGCCGVPASRRRFWCQDHGAIGGQPGRAGCSALTAEQIKKLDGVSNPKLNFPHDFLETVKAFGYNGSNIDGQEAAVNPLSPASDAERY